MYKKIKSSIHKLFSPIDDRSVLFYRNFQGFQGGHLKTWNYYQHLNNFQGFTPRIYFSDNSVWDQNPWKDNCVPEKKWEPAKADILFLAGLDWGALDSTEADHDQPVINLVQAVRHADPEDIRYTYLSRRAIRICVSEEVSTALYKTKQVNGPIFTIPNGIDIGGISKASSAYEYDVFISGLKNRDMAKKIKLKLEEMNISVECVLSSLSRNLYLEKIAQAKVSLLLPAKAEGFYLPALESMATGTLTICPDCVGNRNYCKHGVNCYMPEYQFNSLIDSAVMALNMNSGEYDIMVREGLLTSEEHSLKKEENSFLEIMNNIDQIW